MQAIYLCGWQVAADANLAGHTYPDQSLYPANSVPAVVRRINNAMIRADQIAWANGENRDRPGELIVPIVADAEAGFGGPLNAFELMKQMIMAGAAGVHWEDQLASRRSAAILAARCSFPPDSTSGLSTPLAADIMGTETLIIARTDALGATLITSDVDPVDAPFCTGERTNEGFYRVRSGLGPVLARAKAYAPYADLIWVETGTPTSVWHASLPPSCTRTFRASCSRTTARRRSTGRPASTIARSPSSKIDSASSATASSSSPWPASTR